MTRVLTEASAGSETGLELFDWACAGGDVAELAGPGPVPATATTELEAKVSLEIAAFDLLQENDSNMSPSLNILPSSEK